MFEDIKRNKIHTGIIISIFILIITLIIYYVCHALDLGEFSLIIALIFSISSTFVTYYNCDKIVLKINKARPATKEENQYLVNILDALVISAGLQHTPALYVVEDNQPNAFATGRDPEHSVICVTTGLLDKLEYYELEGVIAHELSHIKNYDIRLSAIVSVMIGFVVMISDMFSHSLFWRGIEDNDDDSKGNAILMIIGLILLIISPIVGKLMQLAISRKREYMADATAVEFTRNPQGLISALRKLDSDSSKADFANSATANMYIVNPFKGEKEKRKSDLFSTHPNIEDRIAALENLK